MAAWAVELHPDVDAWFMKLVEEDCETADLVEQAVDMLAAKGPTLGRPLVDHIKTSTFHNMKELRPASSGRTEVRILFAFDPRREAILLADRRYAEHLSAAEESERRG